MYPKEELAQPVGNAKIRGEFDADAATAVGPNTNDAVLFLHLRSDHDGNVTGLSLAGTILARRYKILNELGDAGNSILYDALQGSPLFETSALYQLFQERA